MSTIYAAERYYNTDEILHLGAAKIVVPSKEEKAIQRKDAHGGSASTFVPLENGQGNINKNSPLFLTLLIKNRAPMN